MSDATIIDMKARPMNSANLCFEVSGILDQLNVQLGSPVQSFGFDYFYSILTTTYAPGNAPGDESLLEYNSLGISNDPVFVAPFTLATLRAASIAAALDKTIKARQNEYYTKYATAFFGLPGLLPITNMMYNLYGSGAGSKYDLLQQLGTVANNQTNALLGAYASDAVRNPAGSNGGVVQSTNSNIQSTGGHAEEEMSVGDVSGTLPPLPPGGQTFPGGTGFTGPVGPTDTLWQGTTGETQKVVNTDYGFRTPYFESQAQGLRSSISLADQQFAAFMDAQRMPNISQIFENNLASIDLDVKRLQITFLNTILLSPIRGVVTGLYKNPGEVVRAGEPVMRVEDNTNIYLMAKVVYRGPIVIAPPGVPPPPNSSVTVHTQLFDNAPLAQPLKGVVVSARGHGSDDTWDLVVKCYNLGPSGHAILPLGYHFDYDDTQFTIA
jgi:hypothetical protein